MRALRRIALALVLLALAGVAALALLLPRYVQSDAVRGQIRAAAKDSLGRDLRYAELGFGLFPPSLRVRDPRLAALDPSATPLFEAERLELRVSILPLFAGAVVVDSLVVQGAALHLVRTKEGLQVPELPAPEATPAGKVSGAAPVRVAVRAVELSDARLVLVDASVSPAVTWEARSVDARARFQGADGPLDLDLDFDLATGGAVEARGRIGRDSSFDVTFELSEVALAPAAPYLDEGVRVSGELSGSATLRGTVGEFGASGKLSLRRAELQLSEFVLDGDLTLEADLEGLFTAPRGPVQIDATGAELRYAAIHTRPRGEPKRIEGHLALGSDGDPSLVIDKVTAGRIEGRGAVRFGEQTRVSLRLEPFELADLVRGTPALAAYELAGPVRADEVVWQSSPRDLRGKIHLEGVRAMLEGAPVSARGTLVASGRSIRSRDLVLRAANQPLELDLRLRDFSKFSLRVDARAADSNALLSTFAGQKDLLSGALDLRADLQGDLGETMEVSESLRGGVRLDIGRGRLRGVSFLKLGLSAAGDLGGAGRGLGNLAALALGNLAGTRIPGLASSGPGLDGIYGDRFESIAGTLEVRGGVGHTDDFRITYPGYTADLRGNLDLSDLGLAMTGTLRLSPGIVRALVPGRSAESGTFVLPLVEVSGTLPAPQVQPDPRALLALAQLALPGPGGSVGGLLGTVERALEGAPPRSR